MYKATQLAFRRGELVRVARAHIVERTSDWPNIGRRHNLSMFIAMFLIVILIKLNVVMY